MTTITTPNQQKQTDDPANKQQSYLTFIYQTKLADLFRNVTVTWCKNAVSHSLTFNVENLSIPQKPYTCKIDLNSSQFWGKKGLKSFEIDNGKRVDVYWDFRKAKFSSTPVPSSDYYVAMAYKDEVVLLLGDLKTEAYKRTKRKPSLIEATLLCKKESIYGKKMFCIKATFGHEKEHDIIIENSLFGPGDPEMWISIDGTETIHIMNLHWRFRGNETISVNNTPIQIFWDVHDWLFSKASSTHGLFIFNPRTGEFAGGDDCKDDQSNEGEDRHEDLTISRFCHVLYAWKTE